MSDISGWKTRAVVATDIPTPAAGKVHLFCDVADGVIKYKDSTGTVNTFPSVSNFNGRTGAIVPAQADYDAFFLTPAEGNAAYQPLDSDLTAIAALATTSFGRSFLTQADAAAACTLISVYSQAQSDAQYQPLDSDLTAIAALATTSFGRALLTLADAAALTAQNNVATTLLKGLMSTTDKKRMSQIYDAVADFGFVGDLVTTNATSSMGAATTTLTDTSNPFTAADVGKRITVPRAGAGSGLNALQLTTTIAAFVSAGQVTLTAPSVNAVTNVAVSYGTDNTAAITAMQTLVNTTNAAFPGVKIVFGQSATNAYGFPIPVMFNKAVQIEGIGGGHTTDTGDYTRTGGTRLAWWGASSDGGTDFGAFVTITPTGVQALKHVALRHLWIDCRNNDQNQALYGLKLASCHGFELMDLFIVDAMAAGFWTNVSSTPTEAKDTTRFIVQNFCSRQIDSPAGAITTPFAMTSAVAMTTTPQSLTVAANGLPTAGYLWTVCNMGYPILVKYTGGGGTTTLTGCTVSPEEQVNAPSTVATGNVVQAVPGNGAAMHLDGGTGANTCCGIMMMMQLSHGTTWGPAAIACMNSDSIEFIQCMINGGNNTNDGAVNRIRKPGVRLNGSNTSAALASRNNSFRSGSAGAGGVSVMGLTNAGARLLAQAGPNYWNLYQMGNGEPLPTVEGGAFFDWEPNGGLPDGRLNAASVANQAIANALTLITGSLVAVPPQGFQIGTQLRWVFTGLQTAAAVGACIFTIRIGTLGTTGDAAVLTITLPTSTVAAGTSFSMVIDLTIRTLGAAATVIGKGTLLQGSAAGIGGALSVVMPVPTVATFNSTTAQQFISAAFISGGAGTTVTFEEAHAECVNPANP